MDITEAVNIVNGVLRSVPLNADQHDQVFQAWQELVQAAVRPDPPPVSDNGSASPVPVVSQEN